MPVRLNSLNFKELSTTIQSTLQKSEKLNYVPDDSIVISLQNEKDILPSFELFLIKISPADSGFVIKQPQIGKFYRNTYVVAIELWTKSFQKLAGRLMSGSPKESRGLYEFFQDVSDTLEHNTFDGQLDPYPGSSIGNPVALHDDERIVDGIGFLWYGNQDNIK